MTTHTTMISFVLRSWCALFPLSAFSISVAVMPVHGDLCGLGNGRLEAIISGGTPPYTVLWSNGSTDAIATNLAAGNYSVTVTDALNEQATSGWEVLPWDLGEMAGAWIMSYPGYEDPYCGGALPGPFFRLRIYDEERWRFGLENAPLNTPIYFNGQPINGIHTGALGGPQWNEQGAHTEYYVQIPADCGDAGVQMTIALGGWCDGTITVYPGCPLEVPTVTLLEAMPSCTNRSTGSLKLQFGGGFHGTMNMTGVNFNGGAPSPGDVMDFTGLSAGTYTISYTIGGASLYWMQSCPLPSYQFVVPSNGLTCGTVQGTAFMDYNLNCGKQSNEPGLPSSLILIEPGPHYTTTAGNGTYKVDLPPGTYTVAQLSTVADEHCTGTPQPFTISGSGTITRNFPDTALVPLDVRIQASAGAARPGFELQYALSMLNLTPAQSGALTVTFEFDPILGFTSATPVPTTVTGNTLTWNLAQLSAFQSRGVQVYFQVPPDVELLGDQLVATTNVSTANSDANLTNNTAVVYRTITGAYDPNDKLAVTSTGNNAQWQIGEDEWIDYTIRFQNTGTDTAFHVLITDTLPANLDPGTIAMGAASHNFTWQLRDAGTLKFYFMNILLPDSNINEPRSHGFVSFRIRPHLPLLPGDAITNIANIYFDFNPPVITEPSVLNVVSPIRLDARAWLGGAYNEQTLLMRDDLRTQSLIPLTEPYTALGYSHSGAGGGETISPALLNTSGPTAIVDWVILELRSTAQPSTVLHSRSALLRRDGRITDKDGSSPVAFAAPAGSYRIALRHRNHLGVISAASIILGSSATTWDIRTTNTALFGTMPANVNGTTRLLWSGDGNNDGTVKYAGAENDRDPILVALGGTVPTNELASVYSTLDINMDGVLRYAGANNDRDIILQTIGGTVPTAVKVEQLP